MTSRKDRGDNGKGKEIHDKMIVDPRLREDDKRDRGDDEERAASRGKLAGTNSHKSFRLL